jgi:hypothetical protein
VQVCWQTPLGSGVHFSRWHGNATLASVSSGREPLLHPTATAAATSMSRWSRAMGNKRAIYNMPV